jgi:peptidyl-prolyl cis-trans isomerase D
MSNSVENRRLVSYIFIGAITLLFALEWGPGSRGCDTGNLTEKDSVATVNGHSISVRDFAVRYSEQADQFRRQGIPGEMLKNFGIHRQVLDSLVNAELLAQAAEARGLAASDTDLANMIRDIPAFQKAGKFDRETYANWVHEVEGTTDVLFEEKLRRQLAAQRLLQLVEASVVVSDEEVRTRYAKEGNSAKGTFVRFTPAMFVSQVGTAKPGDVSAWAEANAAAVSEHYEKNKASFFVDEKVRARQILLRIPSEATAEKKSEIKQRAENLRKEIVDDKKNFAEMAKQFSEDTETREAGGDLGFVERLQLPGPFADLLFALKPSEVTAPVETAAGWYIGTLEEKKAPEQKPLESVRLEIAAQLFTKGKAATLARAEAAKALVAVKQGKSLTDLFPASAKDPGKAQFGFAQETKAEAKETGDFNVFSESIPQLGAAPDVMKRILESTKPGVVDQVLEVADAFVVLTLVERKLPSDDEFAKQEVQLRVEALKGKQYETREAFLRGLKQVGSVVTNERAITKIVGEG